MLLREFDIDRWSLAECQWEGVFSELRGEVTALAWTEIEVLRGFVLNVLAPRTAVFWNLDAYEAFQQGQHRAVGGLRKYPGALNDLRDVVLEAGADVRSIYAFVLLGGVSRSFGETFLPDVLPSDYYCLAKRHLSLFVPADCRAPVARYFRRLVDDFGSSSTWVAGSDLRFVVDDEHRRQFPKQYAAFGKPIPLLSQSEMASSIDYLRSIDADSNVEGLRRERAMVAVLAGDVSIALPRSVILDAAAALPLTALLGLRALVATRLCAVSMAERLLRDLNGPGWRHPLLIDTRDSLRGSLLTLLARHPTVFDDPFHAWQTGGCEGLVSLQRSAGST